MNKKLLIGIQIVIVLVLGMIIVKFYGINRHKRLQSEIVTLKEASPELKEFFRQYAWFEEALTKSEDTTALKQFKFFANNNSDFLDYLNNNPEVTSNAFASPDPTSAFKEIFESFSSGE